MMDGMARRESQRLDWVERESERTGKPVGDILQQIMQEYGPKWSVMAMHCGMTTKGVVAMYQRHGVKKRPARHFAFDGVIGSLQTHCNRVGVKYQTLYKYCRSRGLSPIEALEAYKNGKVVRNYGQSRAKQ